MAALVASRFDPCLKTFYRRFVDQGKAKKVALVAVARKLVILSMNCLRSLRENRNWSQSDLAERLGLSRQTINAIENKRYDPSLPLVFQIAQQFDTSIEAVFIP